MESELKTGFNITGSLIVFDFDGTITTSRYRSSWQSVHEYFDTWESHGKKALQDFIDDKINYYEFCKADAYPWINRSEEEYLEALASIKIREGFDELIHFLKIKDCKLAIISMGLGDIVKRIATDYKFDYWIANDVIRQKGRLTGDIIINVDSTRKGTIVKSLIKSYDIPKTKSIAIGDSSADIEMFKEVALSIVIDPSSEKVAESADIVCKTENLEEIIRIFNA
ncbi:MAG: HAD family hydrolase [Candidatus Hodarchaeales archaeon]|jgi:phosphoserine phosphatase